MQSKNPGGCSPPSCRKTRSYGSTVGLVVFPLLTNSCPDWIDGSLGRSTFCVLVRAVNISQIKMRGVFATTNQSLENRKWDFIEVESRVVESNAKRSGVASRTGKAHGLD